MWPEGMHQNIDKKAKMAIVSNDLSYWLALNEWAHLQHNTQTINKLKDLLDRTYKSGRLNFTALIENNFMKGFVNYLSKFNLDAASSVVRDLQNLSIRFLTYTDERYPARLRAISRPPVILFHKGNLLNFDNCVAIVGTRNPSHFARKKARELGQAVARKGYTVVSGLARGIDTEAHCGALDANGKTIAVLGTKINAEIYPKENSKLAVDILESGAILSEVPLFQKSSGNSFIRRNRITSGISKCLVVVELGMSGGTFTQIQYAIKQRRRVFILKPIIKDEKLLKGYTTAINEGAISFTSCQEIINYLGSDKLTSTLDVFS